MELTAFREDADTNAIKLLFVISRFDEGLHVQGIDGCIMLRPTASPAVYIQQMGRALASGSKQPLIFDFVNNYRNVQVYSETSGGACNVFEDEWKSGVKNKSVEFYIFDQMVEFNDLLDELESALYFSNDERWEEYYSLLCEFWNQNYRWPTNLEQYKGQNLGAWCSRQRQNAQYDGYPEDRRKKLNDIHFPFNCIYDYRWEMMYELLCEYFVENQCWPHKEDMYRGKQLGAWCSTQRKFAKNADYPYIRRKKLEDIGFRFDTKNADEEWEKMYVLLCEFYAEHHRWPKSKEPYHGMNLGQWCEDQRKIAKKASYPVTRRQKLEDIGFRFKTRNRNYEWNKMYGLLCEFLNEYHRWPETNEPYRDVNIGSWCRYQKTEANSKTRRYSAEHRQKLEAIGFQFETQDNDVEWNKMFALLCKFLSERHYWPKYKTSYQGENLGHWCCFQKQRAKNNDYPVEYRRKLESIGFCFEVKKQMTWEQWFALLCDFNNKYGRWPTCREKYKERGIGDWCYHQRKNANSPHYSTDRRAKLESIGFPLPKPE